MPYRSYNMKRELFENEKGYGFIIKTSHFSGLDFGSYQLLRSLIVNDMPSECYCEVLNYASPKIGYLVDIWHKARETDGIYPKLAEMRADYVKSGSWKNILGEKGDFVFRDYELYFIISINGKKEQDYYIIDEFRKKIKQCLKNLGRNAEIVGDIRLAVFLREILNPELDSEIRTPSELKNTIGQYLSNDYEINMTQTGVEVINIKSKEKVKYLIFEVEDYPESWRGEESVGLMGNLDQKISIPCPFFIKESFVQQDYEKSKSKANSVRILKMKQGEGQGMSKYIQGMAEEEEDWHLATGCILQGDRLISHTMQIVAIVSNDKYESKIVQIIKDHFLRLRFRVSQVRYNTLNSLISCLPFGFSHYFDQLKRNKVLNTSISRVAQGLLPLYADPANNSNALMMFSGRRGQLFFFDNYVRPANELGNYNMVVIGKSGSGKSVFIQEYTDSILAKRGQVIILDDGMSSKEACNIAKGAYVDFSEENFCVNPFSYYNEESAKQEPKEYTQQFIDLITAMMCILVGIDNNKGTDPEVRGYLTVMGNIIYKVLNEKGSKAGFEDLYYATIEAQKTASHEALPRLRNIADTIEPYSIGRERSHLNGKSSIDITSDFTVFEFSKLQRDKVLQNIVLLSVTFLVYEKIQRRERRVSLIIDEAWRLLTHPAMGSFFEGFARRARKYKASLVTATQRIMDFSEKKNSTAAAVLGNSDWRVLAYTDLTAEAINELKASFDMSDSEIYTLKTIKGEEGAYSEYMIRHSGGAWQLGRLFLDPFSAILYSSSPEDVTALEKLQSTGMKLEDAVATIASKRGVL